MALPDVTKLLGELSELKLIIDPLLIGMRLESFQDEANALIEDGKISIMNAYYTDARERARVKSVFLGTSVGNDRFVEACVEDFLVCTSVCISHDLYGRVDVDRDITQMAVNDVTTFVQRNGLASLCQCYIAIIGFDNNQALDYYDRLTVEDFVSGRKHRPWTPHSLQDELNAGLTLGFYRIVEEENVRYVEMTEYSRQRMQDMKQMLETSGYINQRMKAMYIAQFDQSQDWDEIAHVIGPTWRDERRNFLKFLHIKPGSEVLELGCGTGEFTFGAGLYKAVESTGFITATDPSVGMIHQAQTKLDGLGIHNVSLEAATAERIPFDDDEFDTVVGVSFFHFTERNAAMKEMVRVTRNQGMLAMFQPLAMDTFPPVYREWFGEFFELAAKNGSEMPPNYLPHEGELKALFKAHGLRNVEEVTLPLPAVWGDPETVIRFLMNTVGYFQIQMIYLPWEARQELIHRVLEKGKEMCKKYSLSERTLPTRAVFIKGTVQKA